jgi:hypothetical protein
MTTFYPGKLRTPILSVLNRVDPNGEIFYCTCGKYIDQTGPTNGSTGKTVVVVSYGCIECVEKLRLPDLIYRNGAWGESE